MQMPLGDDFSTSKEQLLARIDVCMGGKVAEELIMGNDKVGNWPIAHKFLLRSIPGCKARGQRRSLCQFYEMHVGHCVGLRAGVVEELTMNIDKAGYKPRGLVSGWMVCASPSCRAGQKVSSWVPTRLEAKACRLRPQCHACAACLPWPCHCGVTSLLAAG